METFTCLFYVIYLVWILATAMVSLDNINSANIIFKFFFPKIAMNWKVYYKTSQVSQLYLGLGILWVKPNYQPIQAGSVKQVQLWTRVQFG